MSEASQAGPLAAVLGHYQQESLRAFEASREAVNSQFSQANGYCSGYHFRRLSEAAEAATVAMLEKARALPMGPDAFDLAKASAANLFDTLALKITPRALDPQRRYFGCHENGVAERLIAQARCNVMEVVEGWESELLAATSAPAKDLALVSRPEKLPRGRPKGSGSFASHDAPLVIEMRESLNSGVATSVANAAMAVAAKAAGNATLESKRDRLVRRFNAENK